MQGASVADALAASPPSAPYADDGAAHGQSEEQQGRGRGEAGTSGGAAAQPHTTRYLAHSLYLTWQPTKVVLMPFVLGMGLTRLLTKQPYLPPVLGLGLLLGQVARGAPLRQLGSPLLVFNINNGI